MKCYPFSISGNTSRMIWICLMLSAIPVVGIGQPAKEYSGEIWKERRVVNSGNLSKLDKARLIIAKKAANECARVLTSAIDRGIKSEKEIFCGLYFPRMPLTSPMTFNTFYDDYTDSTITPIEDQYLNQNPDFIYVALVDRNGYVPSHNTKYSQPYCGKPEIDFQWSRTKRIFNDIAGYNSGRNEQPFLLQIYYRDTGEQLADLSVPVWVKGRHWGCLRIGYMRGE